MLKLAGRSSLSRARAEFGLSTLILVPLTAGDNRLGAFGFSSVAPYEPSPAEMEFLERVATEFAVAVEGFLARQAAVRERDRLRTLFDITNALVSKLAPDELFSAICAQLSKLIRHDYSMLTVCEFRRADVLDLYALHSTGLALIDAAEGTLRSCGHAGGRGARNRKAGSGVRDVDIDALSESPIFGRFVALGFRSICSVPLIAPRSNHRHAGALSNDGRRHGLR